jgi:hypothetical protein
LRGLPLERLDLTSATVTDDDVMALSGLPLSVLTLRDTKVAAWRSSPLPGPL